ncbi:MAG: ABC transporter permease [Omnitrophica WOR_2 bacterium]
MIFLASFRKEIMEQVRTSRLLILTVVLVAFGLMSPLFAKYTPELLRMLPGGEDFASMVPEPTLLDSVAQYVKNVNQFGILLALLFTMGVVAQEKERGTAAMMLVKPISRGAFLLAKFVALGLAFLISIVLAGIGAYYYTMILFSAPDFGAWMALTALIWLQVLVYIALTLLFSTLVRSQAAAAGLGLGAILIFSLLGSLPSLGRYLPGELVSWGMGFFTPARLSAAWPAFWVSLGIILVSLAAAWLVFERQEL